MAINLKNKTTWQFHDTELDCVYPWYTKPALDYLSSLNLSDKIVFEYGLGASSYWWCRKCKSLYGVDNNPEYVQAVKNATDHEAIVWYEEYPDYALKPLTFDFKFDIIIIDGIYREECVPVALKCLKAGGMLIYDNWMQPSVEIQSQYSQELLLSFKHNIFKQDGHPDWATLIVNL